MPRHYQIKRNNPYIMDKDIYMQMFYLIRSYQRLRERKDKILFGSSMLSDGMPSGNNISKPTEDKAIVLYTINEQLQAIEQTIIELNGKYSKTCTGEEFDAHEAFMDYGVFCYYRSKPNKDIAPCTKTWHRFHSEFAYKVAKKLKYF